MVASIPIEYEYVLNRTIWPIDLNRDRVNLGVMALKGIVVEKIFYKVPILQRPILILV